MRIGYFIKNEALRTDARVEALIARLGEAGLSLFEVRQTADLCHDCEMLLSIGGDGTFLDATRIAAGKGVPVLGVNMGRLGFLSGTDAGDVAALLLDGGYRIEERAMLEVTLEDAAGARFEPEPPFWRFALNEVSVLRSGGAMLGIDVTVGGEPLPTYWADGLLVATSSGSTAYSLSVGGPICLPETKVFIVAPISPHNLNVRPLIVPETSRLAITLRSRDSHAVLSMDNRNYTVPAGARIEVSAAPMRLRRLRLGGSNFINALRSRLLWGEDVRNGGMQD